MGNKKVLLISNKVYHYRVPIYNYFFEDFRKNGIDFRLLTNEVQAENPNKPVFQCDVMAFSMPAYFSYITAYQPDVVIFFLHLKDWIVWPLIPFLHSKNIPYIYWGHGINLQDPESTIKSHFFNLLHKFSKAILLYSPDQIEHVQKKYRHKIFIAPNTLNLQAIPEIPESKETLKEQFSIPYKKVVLFVGRIQPRKRLDILLDIFSKRSDTDWGLVIAGPDITDMQRQIVNNSPAIMYLGALYEERQINAVFKLADIFSIPGTIGLGLNQAFHWGLPVVTTKVRHSPEVYYLKDNYNGFLVDVSVEKVEEKIIQLLSDEKMLKEYAENAKRTAREESGIDNMLAGFYNAIRHALHQKAESAGR